MFLDCLIFRLNIFGGSSTGPVIEQGADIKAVSKLAGHASIVTTAIYVDDNPDRLKRLTELAIF